MRNEFKSGLKYPCKRDELLTAEEIKIPKDMVAWILKRLNGKDASEFMLALSTGKPLVKVTEVGHTHQWIPGGTYNHTHKKGDIPHGHHGSRYVATCQGTGKKPRPIRDKIAEGLMKGMGKMLGMPSVPEWDNLADYLKEPYLVFADQIIALVEGEI